MASRTLTLHWPEGIDLHRAIARANEIMTTRAIDFPTAWDLAILELRRHLGDEMQAAGLIARSRNLFGEGA
jgi:hypothetical protein